MLSSIRKILLPVTLDGDSPMAAAQATWLARRFGAELILLHVAPPGTDADWRALDEAGFAGLTVRRMARHGPAARQIVDTARSEAVDLIVLATHARWHTDADTHDNQEARAGARRMFQRFLLHSVAAQVMDEAPCPVWVTPWRENPAPFEARQVLCYLDLRSRSRGVLGVAAPFAVALGARLTIAHVTADTQIYTAGRHTPHTRKLSEALGVHAMAQTAALQKLAGTAAEVAVESGEPPDALARLVTRTGADLVIAAHWQAREYWEEVSSMFDILRHARVPVLMLDPNTPLRTGARPPVAPFSLPMRGLALLAAALLLAVLGWMAYTLAITTGCSRDPTRPACKAMWFTIPKLPDKLPPRPVYRSDPGLDTGKPAKPPAATSFP